MKEITGMTPVHCSLISITLFIMMMMMMMIIIIIVFIYIFPVAVDFMPNMALISKHVRKGVHKMNSERVIPCKYHCLLTEFIQIITKRICSVTFFIRHNFIKEITGMTPVHCNLISIKVYYEDDDDDDDYNYYCIYLYLLSGRML